MNSAWHKLGHELRLLRLAFQFMTRLPVPPIAGFDPAWLAASVRHFALVGALVGAIGGAVAALALQVWPPLVAATLSVATTLWLTVALHEDGLADTADALLGHAGREQALRIMKDARIGSYGAAVLVLSLLLRVLLLAELLQHSPWLAAAACVAAHTAGRAAAVALMASLPYAGDPAQAKAQPLAQPVHAGAAAWAVACGAAALALAPSTGLALITLAALAMLVLGLRRVLRRRLQGFTGDTLGACEQLGELVVLLAWSARGLA